MSFISQPTDTLRVRACGVVVRRGQLLLVRHVHDGRDYWTFPGGGIDDGEPVMDAACREVLEETGLELCAVREIFVFKDTMAVTHGVLMAEPSAAAEPTLGIDPEQAQLPPDERMLRNVGWHPLAEMTLHFPAEIITALVRADISSKVSQHD